MLRAGELRHFGEHRELERDLRILPGAETPIQLVGHEREADTGEQPEQPAEHAARHGVVERRPTRRRDEGVGVTHGLEVVPAALARAEQRVVLAASDRHRLRGLERGHGRGRRARVLHREELRDAVAVDARGRGVLTLRELVLRIGEHLLEQSIAVSLRAGHAVAAPSRRTS